MLGPIEATVAMLAFLTVLLTAGWTWGSTPTAGTVATASGALFAAVVFGQLANAYACRSETRWIGRVGLTGNRLLTYAVGFEIGMLAVFLLVPPLPRLLGGHVPTLLGWSMALLAIPAVLLADGVHKGLRARR